MTPVSANETTDIVSMLPPGEQLRMCREESGLSIEYVAQQLYLSQEQIRAIERNDLDNLPSLTYVVGYWRSYASLLGIDIKDSIEIHRPRDAGQTTSIVLQPDHRKEHGHRERSRIRSGILFCVLSAAFLGAVWFWQNPDSSLIKRWVSSQLQESTGRIPPSASNRNESGVAGNGQIVELQLPGSNESGETILPEPIFPADDPMAGSEVGGDAEGQSQTISRVEGLNTPSPNEIPGTAPAGSADASADIFGNAEPENLPGNLDSEAESGSGDSAAIQEGIESLSSGGNAGQTSTSTGDNPGVLKIQVLQQSWLDVRDATGAKLIYDTVAEGDELVLTGTPPFTVFSGTRSGITVEYLGELFNYRPDKSGLFARFIVGQ